MYVILIDVVHVADGRSADVRVADASPGGRAPAESRLPPGIGGGVLIVIGLAWFAATCGPSIHWIVPILAGAPFGAGMVLGAPSHLPGDFKFHALTILNYTVFLSLMRCALGPAR